MKKYYSLALEDLNQELKAIEACISQFPQQRRSSLLLIEETEYKKLLSSYFIPDNSDMASWVSESYTRNNSHPEGLKFKTNGAFFVRSKSELIIANTLILNKIPFRYECELNLNGMILHPDFTIKHPKTGKIFYWEHFGMMDNPSYATNATSKLQTYISNGIYPTIDLLTTYETKDIPLDIDMVEEIIRYYFF